MVLVPVSAFTGTRALEAALFPHLLVLQVLLVPR